MKTLLVLLLFGVPCLAQNKVVTITNVHENKYAKMCVVTMTILTTDSDLKRLFFECSKWHPGDEITLMPADVRARLEVGDMFFYVYRLNKWIAEIRPKTGREGPG